VAGRDEGDRLAVRRPCGRVVFEVALSELDRRGRPVRRHREEVPRAVAGPADVVQLVLQTREAPRLPTFVVLLSVRGVGHAGDEGEARAVGRPDDLRHVLVETGELARLAAGSRHHVELHGVAVPVGREGEARAVRRPARLGVALRPHGEPARRGRAVDRREPDGAAVAVLLLVDAPDQVGDGHAVGRKARVGGPRQLIDVLGDHARHAGPPLSPERRRGRRPRRRDHTPRGSCSQGASRLQVNLQDLVR